MSQWKLLSLKAENFQPPVLLKWDFEPSRYRVSLTDLTCLWAETLERKEIIKRALITNTSIDPSENTSQLQLLLQNLQRALDRDDNTRLFRSPESGHEGLVLSTEISLPAPLRPLRWHFHLEIASREMFTSDLLLPCLTQQLFARAQVTSLAQQLKVKDNAITKLTEKIQADGTDLNTVIPGAKQLRSGTTPSKGKPLGVAAKGLTQFDENEWRGELLATTSFPSNLRDFLTQVFDPKVTDTPKINFTTRHIDGSWWEHLDQKYGENQEQQLPTSPSWLGSINRQPNPYPNERLDESEDRQRKLALLSEPSLTPVNNTNSALQGPSNMVADDVGTTDDEIETELRPSKIGQNPSTLDANLLAPSKNLQLNSEAQFTGAGSGETKENSQLLCRDDLSTALKGTIARSHDTIEPEFTSNQRVQTGFEQKKSKLGKIGGKGRSGDVANAESRMITTRSVTPTSTRTSPTTKNGTGKYSYSADDGRVKSSIPPPTRETSQERADNKRNYLKQALESKSNPTAKKKRKF